jgi:cysteinyl-tRNA synthetase
MPLRLYNTLTQSKEPFQTVQPGQVGMYVCGPTVYSNSHVGHMVGPVIFDTIKRYLVYLGYDVTWVVNITDVDDKLILQAEKDGTSVKELADRVTEDYLHCLKALGVDGIDHMPKATEHIAEIVAMTQALIDKGFAYASSGDVYFDVAKAPDYGKLSHRDPEGLQAGARIEPSSIKRHPGDFALWTRPTRLAYRVLGHEHEATRRAFRHPRRRPRPGLPAPRERGRSVREL